MVIKNLRILRRKMKMIYITECTKEQVNLVLDAMKPGDEIEIQPVCKWNNSKAVKTEMFILTARDVYVMEMIKTTLK